MINFGFQISDCRMLGVAVVLGFALGVLASEWRARRRERSAIDAAAKRDAEMDAYFRGLSEQWGDDSDHLRNC